MKFAIIRNLVSGDVYYAEKGEGATKNGKRIETSSETELSRSVVGIDMSRASEKTIVSLAPLVAKVKRQVHYGANALELCLLAEGKVEATVDVRGMMRITDFAGGYLIAKEAGAVLTDPEGKNLEPALKLGERFSYVASGNGRIHRQILGALK